jgi:thiol-disulfide isomerase/thioredoxin
MHRRDVVILGAAGAVALAAGAMVGALAIQSTSGAGKLLSASFPDLSGRTRRLIEWRGRVALFNFWAPWCAPCREEMPLLDALGPKYGVSVVGIGIDSEPKIREFVANVGVRYEVLVADVDAIRLVKELGNPAGGLPFTVVLDPAGRIASRKLGAYSAPELEGIVASLLR